MQFSSEEVELLVQITRDASSGRTFLDRFADLQGALSALVPFCDASAFALVPRPGAGPKPGQVVFRDRDTAALVNYAEYFRRHDPMAVTFMEGKGRPYLLSDFVADRAFGKDPFTGEFLPGLGLAHVLAIGHWMPGGQILAFAIHRESRLPDFSEREREVVRLASPDIRRAFHSVLLEERMSQLAGQAEAARAGVLVFDEAGDLLHADGGGAALAGLLRDRRGVPCDLFLGEVRRMLAAGERAPMAITRTYVTVDGRWLQASYSLARRDGLTVVVVLLELLVPAAPDRFEALAAQAGLTPRERAAVELVLQGASNLEIARRLGIALPTVVAHLTRAYRKTGCVGRSELMALFLGEERPGPDR